MVEKQRAAGQLGQTPVQLTPTQDQLLAEFEAENQRQAASRKPRTSDPNFNSEKTNLIVNYLPQNFTDQEFFNLFSTVGKCNKARIIRHRQTGYSYGYGFIDMGSSEDAEKAIKKLNQYQIGHKRLKVAYSLPSGERTRNINLYIKGLPKNWTKRDLENKFRQFGEIRNARILLDPSTQMGTGVGFLLYATKNEAEKACQLMNGETMEDAGEPLQISFARSQSQPPLEWMLQSSILQQAAIASFPGVAQSTSAYKGRRYNPIVRPQSSVQVQQAAQPQRVVLPNQFQQQMIMVPTFNPMAQYQTIAANPAEVGTVQVVQSPAVTAATSQAGQLQAVSQQQQQAQQTQLQTTSPTAVQQQAVSSNVFNPASISQSAAVIQAAPTQATQQAAVTHTTTAQAAGAAAQMITMPINAINQAQLLAAQPYQTQQALTRGFFSTGVI